MKSRSVVLVLLVQALVAGCGSSPNPSLPPASATPPGSPPPSACASANLVASAGPWSGAAGSRGTDVTVKNDGGVACALPGVPQVALVDASGSGLLESTPSPAGGGPALAPGATAGFSIVFSNWCQASVALPLHFRLELAAGPLEIGGLSLGSPEQLPPCNGAGQPATLTASAWGS